MTVVEITPQQAALLRAFDQINAKQEKHEKGWQAAAREAKKLERAGKRAFEETRTPAERLKLKLDELSKAQKTNVIDAETFRRASTKAQEEFRAATEKSTQSTKRFGKSGAAAFGGEMLSGLRAAVPSVLSLGAAVGLVSTAMRDAVEVAKEAAELQKGSRFEVGKLAQLAGGDPAKLKELRQAQREIFLKLGGKDENESARLAFNLASSNALGERDFFARYSRVAGGPEAASEVAAGAAKIREGFGAKETGNLHAIVSKATQAAAPVPSASTAQMLTAMTQVSGVAGELGVRDEEAFGALSVLAQRAKSADVGGTQLQSFLAASKQTGLADQLGKNFSITKVVESIRAKNLNKQELTKYLGRKEAGSAYTFLAQADLGGLSGQIANAQKSDAAEQAIRAWGGALPEAAAGQAAAEGEAANLASKDRIGRITNLREAVRQDQEARMRRAGRGETTASLARMGQGVEDFFNPSANMDPMREALREEIRTPGERTVGSDVLLEQIVALLGESKNVLDQSLVQQAKNSDELKEIFSNQRPAGDHMESHTE